MARYRRKFAVLVMVLPNDTPKFLRVFYLSYSIYCNFSVFFSPHLQYVLQCLYIFMLLRYITTSQSYSTFLTLLQYVLDIPQVDCSHTRICSVDLYVRYSANNVCNLVLHAFSTISFLFMLGPLGSLFLGSEEFDIAFPQFGTDVQFHSEIHPHLRWKLHIQLYSFYSIPYQLIMKLFDPSQ